MALPPLQDLLDRFPDNTTGDISEEDMRDTITDLYNGIIVSGGGGGGSIPVGGVIPWTSTTIPTGFLECDGQLALRATFSDLFTEIGTLYGVGDGATTFNIPDYRGWFLRGHDDGAGNDPDAASRLVAGDGVTSGDNVGTYQNDEFKSHAHVFQSQISGSNRSPGSSGNPLNTTENSNTDVTGGNETRAKNIYVKFIIRAESPVTRFESAEIVVSTGTNNYPLGAHSLPSLPFNVSTVLRCTTAELGFSVADEVRICDPIYNGSAVKGLQTTMNATDGETNQIAGIEILSTSGVLTEITYASWVLVVRAES